MNEPNWEQIWKVERDICYLYHELSEYSGIMGDLAYGTLYTLPYWEFLNLSVRQMRDQERYFVRDGCLVMLLAMAWDMLDGSGSYLMPYLSLCQQAVGEIEPENERTERLVRVVKLALDTIEKESQGGERLNGQPLRDLEKLSAWVNYEYVGGYFKQKAAEIVETYNIYPAKLATEV